MHRSKDKQKVASDKHKVTKDKPRIVIDKPKGEELDVRDPRYWGKSFWFTYDTIVETYVAKQLMDKKRANAFLGTLTTHRQSSSNQSALSLDHRDICFLVKHARIITERFIKQTLLKQDQRKQ